MCSKEVNIEGLIEFLKLKNELTEIEKSILDSYKLIYGKDSSKEQIIYQIKDNRFKYYLIEKEVENIMSTIDRNVSISILSELNIDDLRANLFNQLLILCDKYIVTKYIDKR